MRIVILGVSGQIGKALWNKLKAGPLEVIGTSRYADAKSSLVRFDPFQDDWKILGAADVVVNCIGMISEKRKGDFEEIHIGLTEAMLQHRKSLGNPKIIQVSALCASKGHPVCFFKNKR